MFKIHPDIVDMWIQQNGKMYVAMKTRTAYLPKSAQLPSLHVPDSSVNISIFIAIIIAVLLFIVLNKTTFGYELKATGLRAVWQDLAELSVFWRLPRSREAV